MKQTCVVKKVKVKVWLPVITSLPAVALSLVSPAKLLFKMLTYFPINSNLQKTKH